MAQTAIQELIDHMLTNIGQDIVAADKKFKHIFEILSGTCMYREETTIGPRKKVMFKCTHPRLADPQFGWGCTMGTCPYLAGAMDWRANNIE